MTGTATPIDEIEIGPAPSVAYASQWRLMWQRFCRHRLAVAGLIVTGLVYFIAIFAEVIAPDDPEKANALLVYHPPQMIHFIDHTEAGWSFRPHVQAFTMKRDPRTLKPIFVPDEGKKIYLRFFGPGDPYRMWGLFPMNIHLLATENPSDSFFLFGSDRLGRDMLSRTVYGARITMSLGLVGVTFSVILGIVLGGISGYYGGKVDWTIQRVVEYILSLPTIPLWLALAAALPKNWSPQMQYLAITSIISLVAWTELARVVRGRFLAMRGEVFVTAARLDGASEARIIFRHMLPSLASHIIAAVSLAVPMMILAETALSFLGLGLQPPAISWGVLLKESQNIRSIAAAPWVFIPGIAVIITVLSLNFVGDGLRDAADPYAH
jgi:peptide/nickel transport system permease protein